VLAARSKENAMWTRKLAWSDAPVTVHWPLEAVHHPKRAFFVLYYCISGRKPVGPSLTCRKLCRDCPVSTDSGPPIHWMRRRPGKAHSNLVPKFCHSPSYCSRVSSPPTVSRHRTSPFNAILQPSHISADSWIPADRLDCRDGRTGAQRSSHFTRSHAGISASRSYCVMSSHTLPMEDSRKMAVSLSGHLRCRPLEKTDYIHSISPMPFH
jgi:hypothetical protein